MELNQLKRPRDYWPFLAALPLLLFWAYGVMRPYPESAAQPAYSDVRIVNSPLRVAIVNEPSGQPVPPTPEPTPTPEPAPDPVPDPEPVPVPEPIPAPPPQTDPTPPVQGASTISSLPWSSPASGSYVLGANLSGSITVRHDNVTVGLGGKTLSWSGSGAFFDSGGRTNVRLLGPGRIVQGTANPPALQLGAMLDGSQVLVDGIEFVLRATPSAASRTWLKGKGGGSSSVRNCSFDISGNGPWYLTDGLEDYLFTQNSVTVHDWTHSQQYYYSRMFRDSARTTFSYNRIDVKSSAHITNLWIAWGDDAYNVHHNTVTFAAPHGRFFMADQGCEDWFVEHNSFTVTSKVPGGNAVYVFRARVDQASSNPCEGHVFRNNLIDTSQSSGSVFAVSLGDSGGPTRDILIHENVFRGRGSLIDYYGGSVTDVRITCNDARDWSGSAAESHGGFSYSGNSWQGSSGCWQGAGVK